MGSWYQKVQTILGSPGRAVLLFAFVLYVILLGLPVSMDIPDQLFTLKKVIEGQVALPPTALFYILVWIGALGQPNFFILTCSALGVLTILVTFRWWITRRVLSEYFGETHATDTYGWLAASLALVTSLPTLDIIIKKWYIVGQPSPNYWMNGTLLASWPFALILFWQSWKQLERGPDRRWTLWMCLWLFAVAFSKISYALVFAVIYPLFLIGQFGLKNAAVRWQLLPFIGLAILVAIQYYLVFLNPDSVYVRDFNHGQPSGVIINPLVAWQMWTTSIHMSIVAGVAFPIAVAYVWWQDLKKKLLFWYAWANFAFGALIYLLFQQTGEEYYTSAFRFQNYITAYILYMVSLIYVWERMRHIPIEALRTHLIRHKRQGIVVIIYIAHLGSGVLYILKMIRTLNHY